MSEAAGICDAGPIHKESVFRLPLARKAVVGKSFFYNLGTPHMNADSLGPSVL